MSSKDVGGNSADFEQRKLDHIKLALDPRTEARGLSLLDQVQLTPEALPDFNFSDISIETQSLGMKFHRPYFVSSMTAGNSLSTNINLKLAQVCSQFGILFGVGSQRRELVDDLAKSEWISLRNKNPDTIIFGNLGIAQIIESSPAKIVEILKPLQAQGLFIHLNALQEVLQINGTPNFKGSLVAIEKLKKELSIPIVVKEVGCGISEETFTRLESVGVDAVDVAGTGGTHWGRVEGLRSEPDSKLYKASLTFKDWGLPTVESLIIGQAAMKSTPVWASGGVRSGLDIAKFLALGAELIGLARPIMDAITSNDEASIFKLFELYDYELRTAMFCTGSVKVEDLKHKVRS